MDSNLRDVAKRISESYKWLSQCGVSLPPEKQMEIAASMAVAASIADAKDVLQDLHQKFDSLYVEIVNSVSLSDPVRVEIVNSVSLSEPVRVDVDGKVYLDEPVSVNVNH